MFVKSINQICLGGCLIGNSEVSVEKLRIFHRKILNVYIFPSAWSPSQWLYFPASCTARHGHVTKFRPRKCGQKWSVPFPGCALKRNGYKRVYAASAPCSFVPLTTGWHPVVIVWTAAATLGSEMEASYWGWLSCLPSPMTSGSEIFCVRGTNYYFVLATVYIFGSFLLLQIRLHII